MATIDELRTVFDSFTHEQKNKYILSIKERAETGGNAEFKEFYDECVQKYNEEAPVVLQPPAAPEGDEKAKKKAKKPAKKKKTKAAEETAAEEASAEGTAEGAAAGETKEETGTEGAAAEEAAETAEEPAEKKPRKKAIVIIAALVLLIGIGGALAFLFWDSIFPEAETDSPYDNGGEQADTSPEDDDSGTIASSGQALAYLADALDETESALKSSSAGSGMLIADVITDDGEHISGYYFPVGTSLVNVPGGRLYYEPVEAFIVTADGGIYFTYLYDSVDGELVAREYTPGMFSKDEPSPPQDVSMEKAKAYLEKMLGIAQPSEYFAVSRAELEEREGLYPNAMEVIYSGGGIVEGYYFMLLFGESLESAIEEYNETAGNSLATAYLVAYDGSIYEFKTNTDNTLAGAWEPGVQGSGFPKYVTISLLDGADIIGTAADEYPGMFEEATGTDIFEEEGYIFTNYYFESYNTQIQTVEKPDSPAGSIIRVVWTGVDGMPVHGIKIGDSIASAVDTLEELGFSYNTDLTEDAKAYGDGAYGYYKVRENDGTAVQLFGDKNARVYSAMIYRGNLSAWPEWADG